MKKIFIILFLLIIFLNLMSCKNKKEEVILISSKGKFLILDENLNLIKKIEKNLDGKVLISEVNGDLVLFNLQSYNPSKNRIFLLNLKSEEIINITEDIEGTFLYKPKFYDSENVIFSVRDKNALESLYIYSLKDKTIKLISKEVKSSYIYPFYIDNINKKIYVHLLKQNEINSKIALYDLNKDEFIENYINFENHFFITESNENGEFILLNYDIKNDTQKIQIFDLKKKDSKDIFEIKNGYIHNVLFSDDSNFILFEFIPYEIEKKPLIYVIDKSGKLIKEISFPIDSDFYILNSKKDQIFIMAQKEGETKYKLYSLNINNNELKEFTANDKFFGGDLLISKEKEKIIISEFKDNPSNKDFLMMNINGTERKSLLEKLNIDNIDSILFLK